jgi:hypothetical protein
MSNKEETHKKRDGKVTPEFKKMLDELYEKNKRLMDELAKY